MPTSKMKVTSETGDIGWVLGVDRSRISPAELAARLLIKSSNFEIVGELKI